MTSHMTLHSSMHDHYISINLIELFLYVYSWPAAYQRKEDSELPGRKIASHFGLHVINS